MTRCHAELVSASDLSFGFDLTLIRLPLITSCELWHVNLNEPMVPIFLFHLYQKAKMTMSKESSRRPASLVLARGPYLRYPP